MSALNVRPVGIESHVPTALGTGVVPVLVLARVPLLLVELDATGHGRFELA